MRRNVPSPPTATNIADVGLYAPASASAATDRLGWPAFAPVATAALLSLGCGEGETVSYKTDIRPLLQARCVVCHGDDNELSLTDPFHPDRGLFMVKNTWFEGHGGLEYNVVPYDPESSFLIQKVSDPELLPSDCDPFAEGVECPNERAGLFMPPRPASTTSEQNAVVRRWIAEGAGDTAHFRERVVPFFGKWWTFNGRSCAEAGYQTFCVPCITCHYENGPVVPNLRVPNFEDRALTTEQQDAAVAGWLESVVGVKAKFRNDLDLVAPGNPDESFLLMKIEAPRPSSAVGAPMPLGFEPLSAAQVEMLRTWILEGARNN